MLVREIPTPNPGFYLNEQKQFSLVSTTGFNIGLSEGKS